VRGSKGDLEREEKEREEREYTKEQGAVKNEEKKNDAETYG
jgi:hypothetical protein